MKNLLLLAALSLAPLPTYAADATISTTAAAAVEQKRVRALMDFGVPPTLVLQDPAVLTNDQKVVELYTLTPEEEKKVMAPGLGLPDFLKMMMPGLAQEKRQNPTKTGTALLELLESRPDSEIRSITKYKFWMLVQAVDDYAKRADDPRYQAHPELLAVYKRKITDVLSRDFAGDDENAGLGKSAKLRDTLKERRAALATAIAAAESAGTLPADKLEFLRRVHGELGTLQYDAAGAPLIPSTLRHLVTAIPEKELSEHQWSTLFACYPMGESLWASRVDKLWRKKLDGEGVTIAVLDTGIDKDHPFLKGSVVDGRNFTNHRFVDRSDVRFGTPDNRGRHGTHVASTVLAYAPGAEIVNLKVLDEEAASEIPPELQHDSMMTVAAIKNGLSEVWQHNDDVAAGRKKGKKIDIVSMSLGIPGSNTATHDPQNTDELTSWVAKLSQQGVVVVVAAGNESTKDMRRPAIAPEAITVGAVDYFKRITDFSSDMTVLDPKKGTVTEKPDVWAYGKDVHAAAFDKSGGYDDPDKLAERMNGTSMATPHVAGIVALLMQEGRKHGVELTPAQVKQVLQATAVEPVNGNPFGRTGGIVDPNAAVAYLRKTLTGAKPAVGK